jgi:hypothetical protein
MFYHFSEISSFSILTLQLAATGSGDLIYSLGTTQIDCFAYFFVDKYPTIAHRDSGRYNQKACALFVKDMNYSEFKSSLFFSHVSESINFLKLRNILQRFFL